MYVGYFNEIQGCIFFCIRPTLGEKKIQEHPIFSLFLIFNIIIKHGKAKMYLYLPKISNFIVSYDLIIHFCMLAMKFGGDMRKHLRKFRTGGGKEIHTEEYTPLIMI